MNCSNIDSEYIASQFKSVITTFITPCSLALLTIAGCAITGHLSGLVAGGCAVGLSVPTLIALVMHLKEPRGRRIRMAMIVSNIAIVVLGILAIQGVFSPKIAFSVSSSLLGINLLMIVALRCFFKTHEEESEHTNKNFYASLKVL